MNEIEPQKLSRILELVLKQMRNIATADELAELALLREETGFNQWQ